MSAVQRIKAVHARNLVVQRSRLASMPEVGIFWLIDDKLAADSIPWRQADIDGGFYNGALWTALQRLLPNGRVWSIPITRAAGCSFIRRKKSFLFIRRKPSSIARK